MIKDNYNGSFDLICNGCGCEENVDGEFQEVVQYARDEKWFARKDKGINEWEHYCPECKTLEGL